VYVLELAIALLVVGLVLLAAMAVRRRLLQRQGGTIELSMRMKPSATGRGWVLGLGRFEGDALQWYRVFSLSPRPRRSLCRGELEVRDRREPTRVEAHALLSGAVVLCCDSSAGPVELGIERGAVTGFLAWLESRPPGATVPDAGVRG
jgi:Protein of unknown function (DUF2550)